MWGEVRKRGTDGEGGGEKRSGRVVFRGGVMVGE